jgi:U5 small nuclear ribonucleoprotein component
MKEGQQDLFDEFGNYIGPMENSDSESDEDMFDDKAASQQGEDREDEHANDNADSVNDDQMNKVTDIVLFEDKEYYPKLEQAYPEAEVRIEEEDTQDIDQPILPPVKKQQFNLQGKSHMEGKSH